MEVAAYIEEMSLELGSMARLSHLSSLAYFIDMVRLEAATIRLSLQGDDGGGGPRKATER